MKDLSQHYHAEQKIRTQLFEDFEQRYQIVYADSDELKREVYKIRRLERDRGSLRLDDPATTSVIDTFDCDAQHLLIKHLASDVFTGCVRLFIPQNDYQALSLKRAYSERAPCLADCLNKLPKGNYGEISSLSLRRIPDFISHRDSAALSQEFAQQIMALHLAAIAMARQLFLSDVVSLMPPMLFKKVRSLGVLFEQAGPVFNDNGCQALYRLRVETASSVSSNLQNTMSHIAGQLSTQLGLFPAVQESADTH